MTMTTTEPLMAPVVPEQAPCDRDCDKPAVYAYLWDWGERGTCCDLHAILLQQVGTQISRTVQLHPLAPPGNQPVTRDERVKLQAHALVLEAELEDVKTRGLELYRLNNELLKTNNMLTVREREAKAQLKDSQLEVAQLKDAVAARDAEHGGLVLEVERLRTLEKMVNAPEREEPTSAPNVVDG
jgi:hypothetical protein